MLSLLHRRIQRHLLSLLSRIHTRTIFRTAQVRSRDALLLAPRLGRHRRRVRALVDGGQARRRPRHRRVHQPQPLRRVVERRGRGGRGGRGGHGGGVVVGGHRGGRLADDAADADVETGHVEATVARRRGVGGDVVLVAGRHAVLLDAVGPAVVFVCEVAKAFN